jgi:hypothetical protein
MGERAVNVLRKNQIWIRKDGTGTWPIGADIINISSMPTPKKFHTNQQIASMVK